MSLTLAPAWEPLSDRSIAGEIIRRDEAVSVLRCSDDDLLGLLHAVFRVRRTYWGRRVRLHVLQNAKKGSCSEDCGFCSQSAHYDSPTGEYKMQSVEEIVEGARRAKRARAWKYCIVTAVRAPSQRDLDTVCEAVRRIKAELDIKVCTSMGMLTPEKARRLKEAGVDRFNHNLETSERFFPEVVTTHKWADRVKTVKVAKEAGMEACSGGIVGMGETEEDVLDLAYALREIEAESVPVNFLDPRPGTPLESLPRVTPAYCLKVLCMFRLVHPKADLRVAGGREVNLRWMQPMALYAVNSIFTSGYLTTPGAHPSQDHQMIRDMGFEIEEAPAEAEQCGCGDARSATW
ncbi:MAG: biotin synthase BioB [Deltaproteobacteria bacterium]|nr:biotin synthase BioB [Deltaproteobacteria bacterium]